MPDTVQHHLRDGALAVDVLVASFVIDCAGQAVEGLRAGRRVALERERRGGGVRT